MTIDRRKVLQGFAAAAGTATIGAPALAQAKTKIRIGYLHTLAVDGQLWLAQHLGAFEKNGLEPELKLFQTGLELFQAMIGGSLDTLVTGAVVSNFPARGQGKVFLANTVEFATAQLWVREDQGIKTIADLKGKRVATTAGTTAHVFLDNALKANGMTGKDIELLNQRMPDAVTSFISGSVPAVALWVPFNVTVRDKVPGAKKLVDASAFYPQAAILGGWVSTAEYHAKNRDALVRLSKAWMAGNEFLTSKTAEALSIIHKQYPNLTEADLKDQFAAQKVFPAAEWSKLYADGSVVKWLQQVTDFFVSTGNIEKPVPASQYFDPTIFADANKA